MRYVGYNTGSTGTVTVSGSASKWTNYDGLYVGYSGSGSLAITNGGSVAACAVSGPRIWIWLHRL